MLLPPMTDYWETVRSYSRPPLPETFNFADVVDGHAQDPGRQALIWTNAEGDWKRFTFAEIAERSKRMASVLRDQGVGRGDRVIVMVPRIPEWQIAITALARLGAVAVPCLTMLTPKDLEYRIEATEPKAILTVRGETPKFEGRVPANCAKLAVPYGPGEMPDDWTDLRAAMRGASAEIGSERMRREDPGYIYFTSGSTGTPKGVTHTSMFVLGFHEIAAYWFDMNDQSPDDICWGTADTAWGFNATSTLMGPWLAGVCAFVHDGPFDPRKRLELIETWGVTIYAAAASEYRWMLGEDVASFDLSKLRLSITAGESLDAPTAERWMRLSGTKFLESYGQTESFMSIANFPCAEIRPGSMGLPMPGFPVDVIHEETCEPLGPGETGAVALKCPFDGLMLGYWRDPERTEACFRTAADGTKWFITGDLARKDADGYFWYEGRADDVINAAGYRIGPAEVEGAVMSHDAVRECACVASPDEKRGVVVKAFVVLHDGHAADEAMAKALQDHVKAQTAPYKYPRKIEFLDELPKTVSGKVQRRVLRDLEYQRARERVA
ncbi:AMP-binding protein [Albimonas sp. CAU 1670]|uniref:acyl-CoA synthetase n=1 Tax=Albimonas sp. CAU 1670 TaxID=3032599 RepID=UPI0023DCE79E|nr:AMP-binding protein [Albimonas sp. CAU 1670]MDF2231808.1 AMP-binding protein [Albimonas sp. CAU 1670]